MERINVVGTSFSGKTTLARAVARRLDLTPARSPSEAERWLRDLRVPGRGR